MMIICPKYMLEVGQSMEKNKWKNQKTKIIPTKYKATENINMIKVKSQINENIKRKEFTVLDARNKKRF